MSIDNVRRIVELIDDIDRAEGLKAYPRYRESMANISQRFGQSIESTTAAFAALSPNNDYLGNLRSLITLLEARRHGRPLADVTVSTYKACARRAWRFLDGEEFLEVTRGEKTRNFYVNILHPDDEQAVTIDGHMIGLWFGARMTMRDAVIRRVKYSTVADDFRKVAREQGLKPCELQAMLWFTWKRINRVVYTPQLGLFDDGNQWRILVDVDSIRPFVRSA